MRNVFDHYTEPENRMTHALMTAINEDRNLLASFLRDLVKVKPPVKAAALIVLEQQYPDGVELSEEKLDMRGIPDGWIFDDKDWCVFIECKVLAKLDAKQIRRHCETAVSRGFKSVTAVAITPRPEKYLPENTIHLEWRTVYVWLRRNISHSNWAAKSAKYFEILELRLIESGQFEEGSLTMFSGVPFNRDYPFEYRDGKRVLALAMEELRKRRDLVLQLGMNADAPGRPAITGSKEDRVWDFLSLAVENADSAFTKFPHLTLSFNSQHAEAMVTVPNAVNNSMRRNLIDLELDGFQLLMTDIVSNLKPLLRERSGVLPWFRGVQRRYASQRSKPSIDACIDFDLRTAVPSSGPPKTQLRWLSAAYDSFVNKEGSNYQIQVGVVFPFESCHALSSPAAIELFAKAWIGCKPLIKLARATTSS